MKVIRTLSMVCVLALIAGSVAAQDLAPVRVGGNISAPTKIKDVAPVMPPIAVTARVQGVVILETTIGTDGTVVSAVVLRGNPLLNQAAIEAVLQWAFKPTVLNGVPVPVIMTVTVNFQLTDPADATIVQPPSPPSPPSDVKAIRVGGDISAPKKIVDVPPVYPPDAQAAGISGIVIIEATIGTDGKVASAKVLKSITGLDDAAVAAVLQWEFAKTLLNGVPVPVIMTITVNFTTK